MKHLAKKAAAGVLAAALACVSLLGCAAGNQAQDTFTNPVDHSGQDPYVTYHEGYYYYAKSVNGSITVARTRSLTQLGGAAPVAVWTAPEGDCEYNQEIWAPELHFIDGRWYIYFAASNGMNATHRMYVLESDTDDPQGSYTFQGKLADPEEDFWAIDGTVLQYGGEMYFIWSGWEKLLSGFPQNLYIAKMSDPCTLSSGRVLISQPEYDWEFGGGNGINEGPQVLEHDGQVYIIYSASGSSTDYYCLGQLSLVGTDPLDPESWSKKETSVFESANGVYAPGHCSFTVSPDGTENWIVYHTAKAQFSGWEREVHIQSFTWNADGSPNFGQPLAEETAIALPSGTQESAREAVDIILNPDFEGLEGWNVSGNEASSATASDGQTSYLVHNADSGGYEVQTYQTITGIENGAYTLTAWVRSSGGQTRVVMEMGDYDELGSSKALLIPACQEWTQIRLTVPVSAGQVTIRFYSKANAGQWLQVDRVAMECAQNTE